MKFKKYIAIGCVLALLSACGDKEDLSLVELDDPTSQQEEVVEVLTNDETVQKPVAVEAEVGEEPEPVEEPVEELVEEPVEEVEEVLPPDYEGLGVNEIGHIMVIMYHGIKDNPPYHRTVENFKKDLQYMYDNNYRLVTMAEYFSGHMDVQAGCTPILLTFDDGLKSTFYLEEVDGQLVPGSDTAVGILEAFIAEHEEFGHGGVLFINNNGNATFEGALTLEERLNWLVDHGYEIGNHTSSHPNLSKLSSESVQSEIGKVEKVILNAMPDYDVLGLSYPFGIRPVEVNRPLALEGVYEGEAYNHIGAFAVGPTGPYLPPLHENFVNLLIPRARGSEGEAGDMWHYFAYYENNPVKRYISDGNPDTLVVPEALVEVINQDKLNTLELITY